MDFHLKQWRGHQQQQQNESDSIKLPTLHLDHHQHQHQTPDNSSSSPALSLFSPEPSSTKLSTFPPDSSPTKMGEGYFSMGQWQELELQALIYRHMLTGSAIPPELLHLLLKKSLINSPSPSSYYQFSHPYQHYPHFQPALMQSGYWGRGAMDPEPGRCRRTDGKKWRCSRDIVAGHKYCERHVHRGRNRSRKPVEVPSPTTTNIPMSGGGGGGGNGTTLYSCGGNGGSMTKVMNTEPMIENKNLLRSQTEDDKSDGRILRPFFDDWPRSIDDNGSSNTRSLTTSTNLSISVPENPSSDFSLKLSTGDGDEEEPGVQERERPLLNWGMTWGSNPVSSVGGPLAEALRSSARSNSSSAAARFCVTSQLHQHLISSSF